MNNTYKAKFCIKNSAGVVIYTNLFRSSSIAGYDWADNYGHVADSLIKFEGWTVCPQ